MIANNLNQFNGERIFQFYYFKLLSFIIQQTTPFKPYQLDSPATPSTKHSNVSSAPGTPSSLDVSHYIIYKHQNTNDPLFIKTDVYS